MPSGTRTLSFHKDVLAENKVNVIWRSINIEVYGKVPGSPEGECATTWKDGCMGRLMACEWVSRRTGGG